jgi:uncharacterized protein (TIGR02246 family)
MRLLPSRTLTGVALLAAVVACAEDETEDAPLSSGDIAAIRELSEAYTGAWLADDSASVLATFTDDAVLMPHHGAPVVEGLDAIRRQFWPPDVPPARVTAFTMEPVEISGSGDLAYARGTISLTFSFESDGVMQTLSNAGNYLMIVRRQPEGAWKIARYIWNDPVPQQE